MSTAFCNLCDPPLRVNLEDLMVHLRVEHAHDPRAHRDGCEMHGCDCIEIETWPDGAPVIVDSTLEPGDFE